MLNYFPHFSISGYSNTYIIGDQNSGDAVVIDPGHFDTKLLDLIEKNDYYVRHVLITHSHRAHIQGLKTLLKIYDAEVFAGVREIEGIPCTRLTQNSELNLLNTPIHVLSVPGHSRDSLVYIIEKSIFTGDVLEAGKIGSTTNDFLKAQLLENVRNKISSFSENFFVFPGHGPVSTLEIEKLHNIEI